MFVAFFIFFLQTCLKVRVLVEETCVFEIGGVHHGKVIVVNETNDVFDGAQVSRLSPTTIHPQALSIQTQTHPLRHIFTVVQQTKVVLAVGVATVNLERQSRRERNERRLLDQPERRQHILDGLIVRRVQNHFEFITRNHFQHVIDDVPNQPVSAQQPLHDLQPIVAFPQLVKVCVSQQSLDVTLLDAVLRRAIGNRFLEIVVVVFRCRRVERLLAIVQVDDVIVVGFVLRLGRRRMGISLTWKFLVVAQIHQQHVTQLQRVQNRNVLRLQQRCADPVHQRCDGRVGGEVFRFGFRKLPFEEFCVGTGAVGEAVGEAVTFLDLQVVPPVGRQEIIQQSHRRLERPAVSRAVNDDVVGVEDLVREEILAAVRGGLWCRRRLLEKVQRMCVRKLHQLPNVEQLRDSSVCQLPE